MKEAAVQNHIRLEAANRGVELWRNNVGVLLDQTGRPVRYGLANTSANVNKNIKSSDLIGITPVFVTPEMIGTLIGVFTAVEVKGSDWRYSETDQRAEAQKRFHDIVRSAGGYAGFATSTEDFKRIVENG